MAHSTSTRTHAVCGSTTFDDQHKMGVGPRHKKHGASHVDAIVRTLFFFYFKSVDIYFERCLRELVFDANLC